MREIWSSVVTLIRELGESDVPAQIGHHRLARASALPRSGSAAPGMWSACRGKISVDREQHMPCIHRPDFLRTFKRREKGLTKVPDGLVYDDAFARETFDPGNAVVIGDFIKRHWHQITKRPGLKDRGATFQNS